MKKTAEYQSRTAKAWIIVFAILLYLCLLPTIILFPLNQTVLDANYFSRLLGEHQIDAILPVMIADTVATAIVKNQSSDLGIQFTSILTQEQIEQFAASIIPAGWTEAQINTIIKAAQDYLNYKSDSLSIRIDLQPIRDNLTSPAGRQNLLTMFSSLPECSFEQLALILSILQTGEGELVMCYPSAVDPSMLDLLIQPIVESVVQMIPAEIVFPSGAQIERWNYFTSSPVIKTLRRLQQGMQFAPWICLILVLLIVLVSNRSMRWMLAGFGLPLVFAGMSTALPGAWIYHNSSQASEILIPDLNLTAWPSVADLAAKMGQELFLSFGRILLIWSLGVLLIGLIFIALRFLAKR